MAQNEIHVNDVGTEFKITLKDNGEVVNLSNFPVRKIHFLKPDGSLLIKNASLYTDGTDGIVFYTATTGDIDQAGTWKIQVILSGVNDKFHSDISTFRVFKNLN